MDILETLEMKRKLSEVITVLAAIKAVTLLMRTYRRETLKADK